MDLPRLILSSDLARLGADARGLARQAKSGQLLRIRQGVYVRAQEWEALPPWDRYRVLIRAAASTLRSRTVFCRQSSAVLWDMPVLGHSHLVHACTSDGGGGRSRAGVRRHLVDLGSVQIEERHGLLVTDRVRTALDLAAFESFEQGVAVFDHVLGPRPGTLAPLSRGVPQRGVPPGPDTSRGPHRRETPGGQDSGHGPARDPLDMDGAGQSRIILRIPGGRRRSPAAAPGLSALIIPPRSRETATISGTRGPDPRRTGPDTAPRSENAAKTVRARPPS